jgi:uncharacterized protein YfaS (alpha-2-macroglobulin family)
MKENIGATAVSISTSGPIEVEGASSHQLTFTKADDKDVMFNLKAKPAIGVSKIVITAKSDKKEAVYKTDLEVRTSAENEYKVSEHEIAPSETIKVNIPGDGIEGSNSATVSIRRTKNLNFGKRLFYLIRYPYGCIEQTTSSVFPQLYLENFIPKSTLAKSDIDDNINRGIKRLKRFKLPSGAFSYWPGSTSPSDWGTNYAGHFMIEAKKLGYHVPESLMDDWIKYQQSQALMATGNMTTRVYRLYLLALVGKPALGAMNLIRESSMPSLRDVDRWMLASAYKLAGLDKEASDIIKGASFIVKLYREFSGTYGSSTRDKAIILDQLVLFNRLNKADELVDELAALLRSKSWMSTQENAFTLLALGKYLKATGGGDRSAISGKITLANGKQVPFDFEDHAFDLAIREDFGKDIKITLDKKTEARKIYVVMEWNGLPLISTQKDESKNLELQVSYLDENGLAKDPATLKQGESLWCRYRVKVKNDRINAEELALSQILPAGWEIENQRLSTSEMPSWTRKFKFKRPEYEDIRDDRIHWFFDMRGYEKYKDFLVKINAVTVGEFFMPGASFHAMYDNEYRATKQGKKVQVIDR